MIRSKLHEFKEIFPTGLVISPSHKAILQNVAPGNIETLFDVVRN